MRLDGLKRLAVFQVLLQAYFCLNSYSYIRTVTSALRAGRTHRFGFALDPENILRNDLYRHKIFAMFPSSSDESPSTRQTYDVHNLICVTIRNIITSTLSVLRLSDFVHWLSGAESSYDTE